MAMTTTMQKRFIQSMCCVFVAVLCIAAGPATGDVQMQYWEDRPTATLDEAIMVTTMAAPTATQILRTMDFPGFTPDKYEYVAKYTGWIVAPMSGDYVFYIASDNDSGFWLSNNTSMPVITDTTVTPPLCSVYGNVGYAQFSILPEQRSLPISLQAGQAYAFTIIHRQVTGGDHATLGWTLPGDKAIEVVGPQYFANEIRAGGPVMPSDGAVDVKSGLLSWLAPVTLGGGGTLTYDIYLDTDPNLFPSSLKESDLLETTYDAGEVDGTNLAFDQVYYWRVDVHDPNMDPNGLGIPVTITGDTWSFTTNDGKPFVVSPPKDFFGKLNGNAVFTVVADTLRKEPLNYQWSFKRFFDESWTDINGATGETLLLEGLQPENRGRYRVTISDSLGNFVQAEANLYMQVGLVHRFSFTDNVEDTVGGLHGTLIVGNPSNYPAVYEDATGTSGEPAKRQLYLRNGPNTPSSGSGNLCYIELPSGIITSLGKQMTIMVWLTWRATSDQNWQGVFNFNSGTTNYITLTPRSDSRTPRFAYRPDELNQWYLFSSNGIPLNAERQTTEYCFAITWNEDTGITAMYVNGNLVSSNRTYFSLSEQLHDINCWLGRQPASSDPAFWGALNEFRIYDVALGAPTISEAHLLGPDVLPANPCVIQPEFDVNNDCMVDIQDLGLLASDWLTCGLTTCE